MTEIRSATTGLRSLSRLFIAPVVALPLLAVACSSNDDIDLATYVENTEPADVLYNQGLANLQAGKMTEASRKFEAVDKQHPYSE